MLKISSGMQNNILGGSNGDPVQTLLAGGILRIYSGTQPTSADESEGAATLLAEVTLNGSAFTPGASSINGLTFDNPANGELPKKASEAWSGVGVAQGNAGWFRFYDSLGATGASTTSVRLDGAIASSGGELTMSNTLVDVATPVVINSFVVSLPKS